MSVQAPSTPQMTVTNSFSEWFVAASQLVQVLKTKPRTRRSGQVSEAVNLFAAASHIPMYMHTYTCIRQIPGRVLEASKCPPDPGVGSGKTRHDLQKTSTRRVFVSAMPDLPTIKHCETPISIHIRTATVLSAKRPTTTTFLRPQGTYLRSVEPVASLGGLLISGRAGHHNHVHLVLLRSVTMVGNRNSDETVTISSTRLDLAFFLPLPFRRNSHHESGRGQSRGQRAEGSWSP